jgi:hypothetical protein
MSVLDTVTPNYVPVQVTIAGELEHGITGQIWSASERFLRMLLRAPIEVGELIEMSIDGCSVNGEVAFCQVGPEGYNVGVQMLDRHSIRREPRFPLDLPAVLTVVGSTGPGEAAVRLTDVSASGVGLFSSSPVQIGACVEINLDFGLLFGEIRHCQESSEGRFRVGVAIYLMLAREQGTKPVRSSPPKFGWLRRKPGLIER